MGDKDSSSRLEEASALQQQDCDHHIEHKDTDTDTGTVTTYCGWFRGLCSMWRSHSQGYETCEEEQEEVKKDHHHRNWLVKELKNVKAELVEILGGAGPKCKTNYFMRRLKRSCSCSSSGSSNKKNKRMQFQYDAKSYALNFDDGTEKELGDDGVYLHFSSRYACPLGDDKQQGISHGIGSKVNQCKYP